MTDRHPFDDLPPDEDPLLDADLATLGALLGDEAVWEEPAPGLEDAVVAAIRREAGAGHSGPAPTAAIDAGPVGPSGPSDGAEVIPLSRPGRRWVGPALGAAAALIVVAAFSLGARLLDTETPADYTVALAGTDLASGAEAVADVTTTPLGTRIMFNVTDLAPAGDGQYYEVWLRESPEVGVSAGTFHLRGGDGSIELWSGVNVDDYPLITVTLQEEGAGAASSGRVVLSGSIDG